MNTYFTIHTRDNVTHLHSPGLPSNLDFAIIATIHEYKFDFWRWSRYKNITKILSFTGIEY